MTKPGAGDRQTVGRILLEATVFVVLIAGLVGCGDSGSAITEFPDGDPARVAAEIDQGAAGLTNSDVYPYDTALGELEEICSESRREITDMAVAGRSTAEEEGAEMSVLDVLQETAAASYAVMENVGAEAGGSCHAALAAAVTARIGGR